jgi:predicted nucleic acid-binding protein
VDANVILRYLLRDDPKQAAKARAIWQSVEEGQTVVVCDPVTLAEVVFVMSSVYKLANQEIAEALLGLLHPDAVVLPQKSRYLRALQLFAGPVAHFGDACACAAALEDCEGRLYSFDRKLSSVPGIERRESPA